MKELDNVTWSEVSNYLIGEIAEDFEVSKSEAKKLLLNALSYNLVINEIKNQVAYILEN